MSNLLGLVFAIRRTVLLVRLRLLALSKRARVDVTIGRGVRLEGRLSIRVHASTTTTIRIGSGTRIGDGVRLVLDGGTLDIGEHVLVRAGVVLHVRGHLTVEDQCLLSYYSVVHCDEAVYISRRAGLSEHTTITDSTHRQPPEGEWWYHHIETAPVHIGAGVWGGAKVTVTRGVTVGADSVIAAGAVVNSDVAPGVVVAGSPAREVATSPFLPPAWDEPQDGE